MKISFFAHSTTTDNELHNATGWLQGELSEKGLQQAAELPGKVVDDSFTVVYSSDLKRGVDSATIGFGKTHKLRQDWRFREANYGTLDGTNKSFKSDMAQFIETPYPYGESYKDTEKRIKEFLDEIKLEFSDGHIAIIGHEATQLAIEVICNNKTWDQVIAENWRPKGTWQPGRFYEYD